MFPCCFLSLNILVFVLFYDTYTILSASLVLCLALGKQKSWLVQFLVSVTEGKLPAAAIFVLLRDSLKGWGDKRWPPECSKHLQTFDDDAHLDRQSQKSFWALHFLKSGCFYTTKCADKIWVTSGREERLHSSAGVDGGGRPRVIYFLFFLLRRRRR